MKTFYSLLLAIGMLNVAAAQDSLYSLNNWSGDGLTQHIINPSTGAISSSQTYAAGNSIFTSSSLAINKSGYMYVIPETNDNSGQFEVYSIPAYPTPTQTTAPTVPSTPVLQADVTPTGINNVFFRRLGMAPDGWAYMIAVEQGTNTIYFSKFLTAADGTASSFTNIGTMTLSDGPSTNFYNGDLAFDGNGTMYVLINADQAGGITKIYKASATTIAAATSNTVLTYQATLFDTNGANFSGPVTGLAFASNGNLYISAQAGSSNAAGIYLISRDNLSGNIVATITTALSKGIGDLTTNYYPTMTILPVNYKFIKAKILNNQLIVDWQTSSEKNNERFDVEVSKDGVNFAKIGTVKSKANNGISGSDLDYQFSIALNETMSVLGLTVFAFAALLLPVAGRRNRITASIMFILGIGLFVTSCNKRQDQVDVDNKDKIFVRLVQYDVDGKHNVSQVTTAYKAD